MSLPLSRHSVCLRETYSEALQVALSCRVSDFASLRFDASGQPQVVFHSVGPIQPSSQSARALPHTVSTGPPQAAARSQAGAPSAVHSSPMDLPVGAPPPQAPWSSGLDEGPSSTSTGSHSFSRGFWLPGRVCGHQEGLRSPSASALIGRSGGVPR